MGKQPRTITKLLCSVLVYTTLTVLVLLLRNTLKTNIYSGHPMYAYIVNNDSHGNYAISTEEHEFGRSENSNYEILQLPTPESKKTKQSVWTKLHQDYITWIYQFCDKANRQQRKDDYNKSLPICQCWDVWNPGIQFEGWSHVEIDIFPQTGELELKHPELQPGGAWSPPDCQARHQVAIIVPFRDRESHLRLFLSAIHPMLQRQKLSYRIIVVEQAAPWIFNKAAMMNIGFREAREIADFDCFIFHDVDMIPEDDRNLYLCSNNPRHVGVHIDKFNYNIKYQRIFGGATGFTEEQFVKANGFANSFYGWGGEDDDMYNRVTAAGMKIERYTGSVARYHMVKHTRDKKNIANHRITGVWYQKAKRSQHLLDGLNTIRYKKVMYEYRPLYTWIYAAVPPKDLVKKSY